jgi:hypothetical protein
MSRVSASQDSSIPEQIQGQPAGIGNRAVKQPGTPPPPMGSSLGKDSGVGSKPLAENRTAAVVGGSNNPKPRKTLPGLEVMVCNAITIITDTNYNASQKDQQALGEVLKEVLTKAGNIVLEKFENKEFEDKALDEALDKALKAIPEEKKSAVFGKFQNFNFERDLKGILKGDLAETLKNLPRQKELQKQEELERTTEDILGFFKDFLDGENFEVGDGDECPEELLEILDPDKMADSVITEMSDKGFKAADGQQEALKVSLSEVLKGI